MTRSLGFRWSTSLGGYEIEHKVSRILAFGPHPDDVEFQCAGTLALLARMGCEIHIAVMTGGQLGSATLPPEEIKTVRLKEGADAAGVIGASLHYAGGHDCEIDYGPEYRRMTVDIIRKVNPQVVFTTPPTDYMIDHEETSRLVRNACFLAAVPFYEREAARPSTNAQDGGGESVARPSTNAQGGGGGNVPQGGDRPPRVEEVPYLYYWDAVGRVDIFGRPLPLQFAVDITEVLDIKERMLACHASQREWLRQHHGMDQYIITMKETAYEQGRLAGCKAAEGFIQHRGHGYPQDNVLSEMLGGLCKEL